MNWTGGWRICYLCGQCKAEWRSRIPSANCLWIWALQWASKLTNCGWAVMSAMKRREWVARHRWLTWQFLLSLCFLMCIIKFRINHFTSNVFPKFQFQMTAYWCEYAICSFLSLFRNPRNTRNSAHWFFLSNSMLRIDEEIAHDSMALGRLCYHGHPTFTKRLCRLYFASMWPCFFYSISVCWYVLLRQRIRCSQTSVGN